MTALLDNLDYVATVVLFAIGLWTLLADPNLIKKLMGLNIMETAVFAFIVTAGMVEGGDAPILGADVVPPFMSPISHALVLTGIVVAVSTTGVALALLLRIHREYGTLEMDELKERW
ncbi:MAG: cation:proton antiporter subunit C [Gemmatimonadota bacterium]